MPRNYQKYKKINTEKYSKGIKNSFYSLISISIGLLFTYLALTKPAETHGSASQRDQSVIEENEDYTYVSMDNDIGKPLRLREPQASEKEKNDKK